MSYLVIIINIQSGDIIDIIKTDFNCVNSVKDSINTKKEIYSPKLQKTYYPLSIEKSKTKDNVYLLSTTLKG